MVKLSVVIIAKNEEERIRGCIGSIKDWADQIIVVDDHSTDNTVKIAEELGAEVFVKKMEVEGAHRNWAYRKSRNQWVLSLDADEILTPQLKEEIAEVLSGQDIYDAFTIPRKNFIGDYWIRWAGLYPAPQLKLFKKDKFRWEEVEVHPRAFLEGKCGHLKNPLLHYTYRNFEDFFRKLNKQTTLEAIKWYKLSFVDPRKARYKMNFLHALWRCLDRFIRSFIVKKGYRDGFVGFMVSFSSSLYQIISYAKYWELKRSSLNLTKQSDFNVK